MPNWCSNSITIQGSTETIKTLWEEATAEDGGLLSAMAPQPKDMFHGNLGEKERKECADKGIPNWFDWNVSNWGTKWDVDTEGLEFTDNGDGTASITGHFESAWAPPIEAYNRFLDDMAGCSITADYHEPGMDFIGEYVDGDDNFYDGVGDLIRGGAMQDDEVLARLVEDYAIEEDMEMWEEETAR